MTPSSSEGPSLTPVATGKQAATSINLFDNNGRLGRLNFEATQCRPSTVGSGHWTRTGPLEVSGFQRMQCGGCRCSRGPFRVRLLVGVRAGDSGSGPGGRVQVQVDRPSPLGGRRPGGPGGGPPPGKGLQRCGIKFNLVSANGPPGSSPGAGAQPEPDSDSEARGVLGGRSRASESNRNSSKLEGC